MVGNDSALNVGSNRKLVVEPAIEAAKAHPSYKLKIAFPNTFNGDRKKLKSFLI
jgi:hypothetical protein